MSYCYYLGSICVPLRTHWVIVRSVVPRINEYLELFKGITVRIESNHFE